MVHFIRKFLSDAIKSPKVLLQAIILFMIFLALIIPFVFDKGYTTDPTIPVNPWDPPPDVYDASKQEN